MKRGKVKMKIKKLNNELKIFYIFTIGQFVSQFGSKLTSYGLILWSYKQSGSVLSMSLLSVSYLVPEVLLSFIAGSVSDGWNKKKIMLISDAIAAIFSVSAILLLITNNLRLEYLYIINFILGITDSFQNPAAEVTVSAIISEDNYIKASGLETLCSSFTGIFTPIIATSLYAFCGLEVIVIIDLLTFIFSFITLAFYVKIPVIVASEESDNENLWEQCKSGIQYLFKRKDIFSLILFMAFVNFIAAIYNTNLSPMILSRSGNNNVQLGIVTSTISIAGIVGSILVTKIPQTAKKIPLIQNIMIFSFLVCNSLLGIGRNYYIWTAAVLMGNALIPLLLANVSYIMRTKIPIEMQGRVFSARNTLQYTSIPVGNVLGGFLADKVFEPYMKKPSILQALFVKIVGEGKGNGIALLYICIGLIGFIGSCMFKLSKSMRMLDIE